MCSIKVRNFKTIVPFHSDIIVNVSIVQGQFSTQISFTMLGRSYCYCFYTDNLDWSTHRSFISSLIYSTYNNERKNEKGSFRAR